MKSILNEVLSVKNQHLRDKNIKYLENEKQYLIIFDPNIKYTSVTSWVYNHFEKFDSENIIKNMIKKNTWKKGHKYWNKTPEEIKIIWESLAISGSDLHYEIECFYNNKQLQSKYTNINLLKYYLNNNLNNNFLEWKYFINFIKDNPNLKPYRTEWSIYHEDAKIAGKIDIVYENQDGTLSIYDWKRSNKITKINNFNKFSIKPLICHLPDTNFWHYALQLNTYKYILETKYNLKIKDLYLVILDPDNKEKNYKLIKLPDLYNEIDELFEEEQLKLNSVDLQII